MIASDQAPGGPDWLVRRVVDLERQVRELQAGRRLEAATIGAGGITIRGGAVRVLDDDGTEVLRVGKDADGRYGLRVNDADGDPQIRAGELAGGGYGLEAVDSAGKLVDLAALAFGQTPAIVATRESTGFGQYTDLATVGPVVSDVEIGTSGRCMVIIGAFMEATAAAGASLNTAGALMSFDVSGPTASLASNARAAALIFQYDTGGPAHDVGYALEGGVSRVIFLRDLAAGTYTFTARYRAFSSADHWFSDRTLIVVPF